MNKKEFLTSLGCDSLDINKSCSVLQDFDLADRWGTRFHLDTPEDMLHKLSELGCNVVNASYVKPEWFVRKESLKSPEVIEVSPEVIPEDVLEKVEETSAPLSVDWGWVDSLSDTRENKKALDEYAATFDVSLRRNMKLENMIKAFKEAMDI